MLISRNTGAKPDPDLYAMLARAGYDALDLNETADPSVFSGTEEENTAFVKNTVRMVWGAGLSVAQCHAPMATPLKGMDRDGVQALIEGIGAALRAIDRAKIPYAVVHPFIWSWSEIEPDRERLTEFNRTYLRTVCAGMTHTVICLENMPGTHGFLRTAQEMKDFLACCDLPDLCVCYDSGHGFSVGQTGADFFGTLGKKIRTLHLHDTVAGTDSHLLMHTGSGDWDLLARAAAQSGFDGALNSESKFFQTLPHDLCEQGQVLEAALLRDLRQKILEQKETAGS